MPPSPAISALGLMRKQGESLCAAMSLKPVETLHEWYYAVHTSEANFCLIPDFFHDHGYFATVVEHNNGDWDKAPKYELYIVE